MMLLVAAPAAAQYSPEKGDVGIEISFDPFNSNNNSFQLKDGYKVRARYFVTDKDAIRLTLGFNVRNTKERADLAKPGADATNAEIEAYEHNKEDFTKNKRAVFGIDLGYERHFSVAKRLDLYAGAELGFAMNFASGKQEDNYPLVDKWYKLTTEREKSNFNGDAAGFAFGIAAFTGLDFYVYKSLYVGAELGLAFNKVSASNYTQTVTDTAPGAPAAVKTEVDVENNVTNVAFYVEPSFRIGWRF